MANDINTPTKASTPYGHTMGHDSGIAPFHSEGSSSTRLWRHDTNVESTHV